MNSKGDVYDFFYIIIAVFMFSISLYAGSKVWSSVDNTMSSGGFYNISGAEDAGVDVEAVAGQVTSTIGLMDYLFAFFFFGFFLSILISVFYLDTNAGFLLFAVLLFILVLFVGMIISDSFASVVDNDELSSESSTFPITLHIMSNLPIYLLGMGSLFFVVLYTSRREGY